MRSDESHEMGREGRSRLLKLGELFFFFLVGSRGTRCDGWVSFGTFCIFCIFGDGGEGVGWGGSEVK